MGRLSWRLLIAALFALLADVMLYGFAPGAGLTVYALLVAAAVAAFYGRRLLRAGPWILLWIVLALGATLDESLIGRSLLVVLGWIILARMYLPEDSLFFSALVRGIVGGVRSMTAAPRDARRFTLLEQSRLLRHDGGRMPSWVYILPLVLTLVFAGLIIPANLVLARWFENAFEELGNLFAGITFSRVFFWIVFGLGFYGTLRFKLGQRPREIRKTAPAEEAFNESNRHELRACMLTFAALNVVFLGANAADFAYLWLSAGLPSGISYAQFAHQGSYRLIVAVVLAAVTITAFFRLNTLQSGNTKARLLAYLFVIQNIIVLLGAGRRLMLYVEVYGLTRWRVATFLWLVLVLAGFILIWIKLRQQRPFLFLLNTNAIATVLLLSVVSFLNIDGFIANWNVFRYESGSHAAVDVGYLGTLDAGAIPALKRLTLVSDIEKSRRAKQELNRLSAAAARQNMYWQSWTWRRSLQE
jgi:hypothetical protein